MKNSNTKNKLLRAVSSVTLCCFLFNQITYANPSAGIEVSVAREIPGALTIDIPADLASLDDMYEAPPARDPKLILSIQDAHANYGAQQKIKQLLAYLNKQYSVNTVFVEGAAETLDPDYLKFFPDAERNLKFADNLAKAGELTGAELFLLEENASRVDGANRLSQASIPHPPSVKAYGIEDVKLYRANFDALKKVFAQEPVINKYTSGLERRLEALTAKAANPDMRRILGDWKKFEKGWREFMPFVKELSRDAKKVLGLDLESLFSQIEWPQLTRLLVLQQMEKELNPKAAEAQKAALVSALKAKGLSNDLINQIENFKDQHINVTRTAASGAAEAVQPRYLLERLTREAGPKGFKFSDYPDFSLQSGYMILKSELDSKSLYNEMNRLFTRILDALAKTDEQKELLSLSRDAELVRKLLNLELTRRDWQEVQTRGDKLAMDSLVARLQKTGREITKHYNLTPSAFDTKTVNSAFHTTVNNSYDAAYDFYSYANKREHVFYQKITEVMNQRSETKAVLITGGFHTDGMTDILREHEVSYGILTPRITETSGTRLYRNVMMQKRELPFEISNLQMVLNLQDAIDQKEMGENVAHRLGGYLVELQKIASEAGQQLSLEDAARIIDQAAKEHARKLPVPANEDARKFAGVESVKDNNNGTVTLTVVYRQNKDTEKTGETYTVPLPARAEVRHDETAAETRRDFLRTTPRNAAGLTVLGSILWNAFFGSTANAEPTIKSGRYKIKFDGDYAQVTGPISVGGISFNKSQASVLRGFFDETSAKIIGVEFEDQAKTRIVIETNQGEIFISRDSGAVTLPKRSEVRHDETAAETRRDFLRTTPRNAAGLTVLGSILWNAFFGSTANAEPTIKSGRYKIKFDGDYAQVTGPISVGGISFNKSQASVLRGFFDETSAKIIGVEFEDQAKTRIVIETNQGEIFISRDSGAVTLPKRSEVRHDETAPETRRDFLRTTPRNAAGLTVLGSILWNAFFGSTANAGPVIKSGAFKIDFSGEYAVVIGPVSVGGISFNKSAESALRSYFDEESPKIKYVEWADEAKTEVEIGIKVGKSSQKIIVNRATGAVTTPARAETRASIAASLHKAASLLGKPWIGYIHYLNRGVQWLDDQFVLGDYIIAKTYGRFFKDPNKIPFSLHVLFFPLYLLTGGITVCCLVLTGITSPIWYPFARLLGFWGTEGEAINPGYMAAIVTALAIPVLGFSLGTGSVLAGSVIGFGLLATYVSINFVNYEIETTDEYATVNEPVENMLVSGKKLSAAGLMAAMARLDSRIESASLKFKQHDGSEAEKERPSLKIDGEPVYVKPVSFNLVDLTDSKSISVSKKGELLQELSKLVSAKQTYAYKVTLDQDSYSNKRISIVIEANEKHYTLKAAAKVLLVLALAAAWIYTFFMGVSGYGIARDPLHAWMVGMSIAALLAGISLGYFLSARDSSESKSVGGWYTVGSSANWENIGRKFDEKAISHELWYLEGAIHTGGDRPESKDPLMARLIALEQEAMPFMARYEDTLPDTKDPNNLKGRFEVAKQELAHAISKRDARLAEHERSTWTHVAFFLLSVTAMLLSFVFPYLGFLAASIVPAIYVSHLKRSGSPVNPWTIFYMSLTFLVPMGALGAITTKAAVQSAVMIAIVTMTAVPWLMNEVNKSRKITIPDTGTQTASSQVSRAADSAKTTPPRSEVRNRTAEDGARANWKSRLLDIPVLKRVIWEGIIWKGIMVAWIAAATASQVSAEEPKIFDPKNDKPDEFGRVYKVENPDALSDMHRQLKEYWGKTDAEATALLKNKDNAARLEGYGIIRNVAEVDPYRNLHSVTVPLSTFSGELSPQAVTAVEKAAMPKAHPFRDFFKAGPRAPKSSGKPAQVAKPTPKQVNHRSESRGDQSRREFLKTAAVVTAAASVSPVASGSPQGKELAIPTEAYQLGKPLAGQTMADVYRNLAMKGSSIAVMVDALSSSIVQRTRETRKQIDLEIVRPLFEKFLHKILDYKDEDGQLVLHKDNAKILLTANALLENDLLTQEERERINDLNPEYQQMIIEKQEVAAEEILRKSGLLKRDGFPGDLERFTKVGSYHGEHALLAPYARAFAVLAAIVYKKDDPKALEQGKNLFSVIEASEATKELEAIQRYVTGTGQLEDTLATSKHNGEWSSMSIADIERLIKEPSVGADHFGIGKSDAKEQTGLRILPKSVNIVSQTIQQEMEKNRPLSIDLVTEVLADPKKIAKFGDSPAEIMFKAMGTLWQKAGKFSPAQRKLLQTMALAGYGRKLEEGLLYSKVPEVTRSSPPKFTWNGIYILPLQETYAELKRSLDMDIVFLQGFAGENRKFETLRELKEISGVLGTLITISKENAGKDTMVRIDEEKYGKTVASLQEMIKLGRLGDQKSVAGEFGIDTGDFGCVAVAGPGIVAWKDSKGGLVYGAMCYVQEIIRQGEKVTSTEFREWIAETGVLTSENRPANVKSVKTLPEQGGVAAPAATPENQSRRSFFRWPSFRSESRALSLLPGDWLFNKGLDGSYTPNTQPLMDAFQHAQQLLQNPEAVTWILSLGVVALIIGIYFGAKLASKILKNLQHNVWPFVLTFLAVCGAVVASGWSEALITGRPNWLLGVDLMGYWFIGLGVYLVVQAMKPRMGEFVFNSVTELPGQSLDHSDEENELAHFRARFAGDDNKIFTIPIGLRGNQNHEALAALQKKLLRKLPDDLEGTVQFAKTITGLSHKREAAVQGHGRLYVVVSKYGNVRCILAHINEDFSGIFFGPENFTIDGEDKNVQLDTFLNPEYRIFAKQATLTAKFSGTSGKTALSLDFANSRSESRADVRVEQSLSQARIAIAGKNYAAKLRNWAAGVILVIAAVVGVAVICPSVLNYFPKFTNMDFASAFIPMIVLPFAALFFQAEVWEQSLKVHKITKSLDIALNGLLAKFTLIAAGGAQLSAAESRKARKDVLKQIIAREPFFGSVEYEAASGTSRFFGGENVSTRLDIEPVTLYVASEKVLGVYITHPRSGKKVFVLNREDLGKVSSVIDIAGVLTQVRGFTAKNIRAEARHDLVKRVQTAAKNAWEHWVEASNDSEVWTGVTVASFLVAVSILFLGHKLHWLHVMCGSFGGVVAALAVTSVVADMVDLHQIGSVQGHVPSEDLYRKQPVNAYSGIIKRGMAKLLPALAIALTCAGMLGAWGEFWGLLTGYVAVTLVAGVVKLFTDVRNDLLNQRPAKKDGGPSAASRPQEGFTHPTADLVHPEFSDQRLIAGPEKESRTPIIPDAPRSEVRVPVTSKMTAIQTAPEVGDKLKKLLSAETANLTALQDITTTAMGKMDFSEMQLSAMTPEMRVAVVLTWGLVSNAETDIKAAATVLIKIAEMVKPETLSGLREMLWEAAGVSAPVSGEEANELKVMYSLPADETALNGVIESLKFFLLLNPNVRYYAIILGQGKDAAVQAERAKAVEKAISDWAVDGIHKPELAKRVQFCAVDQFKPSEAKFHIDRLLSQLQAKSYVVTGVRGALDWLNNKAILRGTQIVESDETEVQDLVGQLAVRRVTTRAAWLLKDVYHVYDVVATLLSQPGLKKNEQGQFYIDKESIGGMLKQMQALFDAFVAIDSAA